MTIAVMGAQNRPPAQLLDMRLCPWPMPQAREDWPLCLDKLISQNITHLFIAPPFVLNWPQIGARFNGQPVSQAGESEPSALLPRLQEQFEISRQGAANIQLLIFTDFSVLEQARPLNYAEASLCHAQQEQHPVIPLAVNRWPGARWRGRLCRQRLGRWAELSPEQRRLEINIISQIALILASLGLLGVWLAGWDTLGWLLILLLYPMNRPFIRLVVDKHPDLVPACLGYCLLRPFAWLAGLLGLDGKNTAIDNADRPQTE